MKLYNVFDEKDRFVGFYTHLSESGRQQDSHGYSYLGQRQLLQECGDVMGFDNPDAPVECRASLSKRG